MISWLKAAAAERVEQGWGFVLLQPLFVLSHTSLLLSLLPRPGQAEAGRR